MKTARPSGQRLLSVERMFQTNETLKSKLMNLPESPGCYIMRSQGEIIYVGKAINLKNRVRSYFHGEHTPKVAAMAEKVDDFDIVLARSNLEALLLECNLIKQHRPFYNILLKDDKQYPYVRIDPASDFPQVTVARRAAKDGARYYGPYLGATAVRNVIETLRKLFPLRTCRDEPLRPDPHRRPCINYEMGRCLAPCAGKCTKEAYAAVISQVTGFLEGDYRRVTDGLRTQMNEAAAAMEYERAAQYRDRIRDIENLMQRQQANRASGGEQDVIALMCDGMDAMAYVLFIRDGKMLGGDAYPLPGEGMEEPEEVLSSFVAQYYDGRKPAREVLVQSLHESDMTDLETYLREKRGGACDLAVPRRGDKKALVLLAQKNAADALNKLKNSRRAVYERTVGACRALQDELGLADYPKRIEGFDISNTQGDLSVAAMVVFTDGAPDKKAYRHFRIRTVEGPNDFESMYEVLSRRLMHTLDENEKQRWPVPDLILVDGGPAQLMYALQAMDDTGVRVPVIGLAERLEEIWLPGSGTPLILSRRSPALHVLQQVRDEAHRFGITHHRALRSKKMVHSALEDIPGIGPARRRALLSRFRSMKAISQADADTLAVVPGMTRAAAEKVYAAFHAEQGSGDGTAQAAPDERR